MVAFGKLLGTFTSRTYAHEVTTRKRVLVRVLVRVPVQQKLETP